MAATPGRREDWRAWLERAPGGAATIRVAGTLTLPTPGHTADLVPAEEPGADPGDELRLRLDVHAPEGLVAQVLTDVVVAWSGPAERAYTTVSIAGVAEAIPVETAA